MPWTKPPIGRVIEGGIYFLEALFAFGLLTGTTVAMALGNFLLGGLLGVFAWGLVVRLKRRAKHE